MFTVDGITWDVLCKIERMAEIKSSDISGMLLNKNYFNDAIGTYMQYDVTIGVPIGKESEYNALYEVLTAPDSDHVFVFPYGNSVIQITGRVANVKDTYQLMPGIGTRWKNTKFTAVANNPSKTASGGV